MKLIPDLIHRNIAGEHLLIPAGETAHTYNGLFVMNPAAQRIRKLPNTDALIPLLLEEYEAERHLLLAGVVEFQDTPKNNGLLI